MSVPPSPSSSLFVLRSNSSKSSLASDTEPEDVQYASSSAVTTPEDDEQVFRLGRAPGDILGEKCPPETPSRRPKLAVETRPRNFSSAVKRMKKAALSFATFKRKRPDDMSPILIVTPLREKFGKSLSIRSNGNFYSTPNLQFSMREFDASDDQRTQTIGRRFDTISGASSSTLLSISAFKRERGSGFRLSEFADIPPGVVLSSKPPTPAVEKEPTVPETQTHSITPRHVLLFLLRALFFLPWCAAVGGALLLFPNHLDLVAFRPGYISSPPRAGLPRFAHWAHFAPQHVMIFLGCVLMVLWYDSMLGLSVAGVVVPRFLCVWHHFRVDRNIPLGEDDRQSLYLIATDAAFVEDTVVTRDQSGEISVIKTYAEGGF
ncbi:hypothetical protein F5I97DRAFT_1931103 [Phlebopus sp. FC_14]|nr:hypothetical protein F5I97DRAFT_1931103 [Phlebopus sp. FC_14]